MLACRREAECYVQLCKSQEKEGRNVLFSIYLPADRKAHIIPEAVLQIKKEKHEMKGDLTLTTPIHIMELS